MVKAVVFDLDDTLVSERQYQDSAHKAVLQHLVSKTGLSSRMITRESEIASEAPRDQYFQTLLPALGMEPSLDAVAELIAIHREHSPEISWYPDVLQSFKTLRSDGAKLGIITDGHAIAQRQKLLAVKASEHVDAIVVSDELGREFWKPHEKTFLVMAEMLEIEIGQLMYVGDNPQKDFFVSSSLPITTVRINRDDSLKGHHDYLGGIEAHYTLARMSEIGTLFRQLRSRTKK